MDKCVCMAETLCCSPKTITTLLIVYTPIQSVFGVKRNFFFKRMKLVPPWWSSGWHSVHPLGAWVWSLVGEWGSYMSCSVAKKNKWIREKINLKKLGTSLEVQWLRILLANARHPSSIPGLGTKIPQASEQLSSTEPASSGACKP